MDKLNFYESTKINDIKLLVDEKEFFTYKSDTSLHSFVTKPAYGFVQERSCIEISNGIEVFGQVILNEKNRRFFLKIIACMPRWKEYVCPLTVKINGKVIYENNETFFEQVCLGWPALYIAVPENVLTVGKNVVSVKSEKELYLSSLSLVSYPEIKNFEQVSIKKYVKVGEKFAIAIKDKERAFSNIIDNENCCFLGASYYKDLVVVSFNTVGEGQTSCCALFGSLKIRLDMPTAILSDDYFVFGSDSDDHRQDDSDETSFIIETLVLSDMGNFIQFRPKFARTYYNLLSKEGFKQLVDFMTAFGVKYGASDDYNGDIRFLPNINPDMFFGFHIHETYLFLNNVLSRQHPMKKFFEKETELIEKAQSFGEAKEIFLSVLRRSISLFSKPVGKTSFGCPSLLCVHEAEVNIDRITIEPCSNINLLTGAVRGTNIELWGAHIPPDWYFGTPVDVVKANKYRLAMQYLYLNGATYVYAENSLFKTNAFSRCDWESDYCAVMRKYQREFYEYTLKHCRKGKLIVENAIAYGRNEFFMWKTNDRIAELKDGKDWDSCVWCKWDNSHHVAWNASEAWLPASDKQYFVENISNLKIFSGTPYGSVDIVSAEKDFSKYSKLVFLGWNTMNDELLERLKDYVYNGGTLMISYAHFNYTDRNDLAFTFPDNDRIKEFIGLEINGVKKVGQTVSIDNEKFDIQQDMQIVTGRTCGAKAIGLDESANGVIYLNNFGKGKVYFVAFRDYVKEENDVALLTHLMKIIGQKSTALCDNNNVSFTVRELDDKYIVSVLNMNCLQTADEQFTINLKGKKISGKIKVGEILEYVIDK